MNKDNIEVGQIYEVITDTFIANDKYNTKRKILLEKGEKIEIRYPYEWHFRIEDNMYFHAESQDILNNCKLFGIIFEQVRWNNKANLDEILRLELYKGV